ncbi:MAG: hypothetical protein KAH56_05445 [Candidatus Krumholzibacteria bacterium]|nr:hypothetical protein [Candidatus Krumholzibacteria bacterium]
MGCSLLAACLMVMFFPVAGRSAEPVADFIPLSEISPGMTGFGLTVFEGTRIDTFGVRVVGVQENVRADGSFLLVEISGHGLEISSIAQGMSGSPVYLDGRFAGALAFGWGGALKPIAGVTPAEEMLALPTRPVASFEAEPGSLAPDLRGLLAPGLFGGQLARDLFPGAASPDEPIRSSFPVPAGQWPASREMIMTLLEDLATNDSGTLPGPESWIVQPVGFTAQTVGGEVDQSGSDPAFQPGSACAIPLITGDAKLGAIGTVTWVDGDQVLMMGHPFMQRGPVDWPLATAEILTVFPSRQMSFKMGTIGHVVGSVHHDQRAGLSGRTGPAPAMVPVSVELELPSVAGAAAGAEKRSYEFAVVDDTQLTPTLVFWALYNSLLAEADDASLQNVSYRIETMWEGSAALEAEPLVLSGVTSGPGGAMRLAAEWMAPLGIILNNSFEKARLKEVRARLVISRPMATATIVGLTGPRVLPEPGSEVVFRVEIQPRLGERQVIEMPVVLPANLEPGSFRVIAASAAELFAFESQRASGRFQVADLGGILEILRTGRSADTLVLALLAPGRNMVIQGQEMHNLPGSVSHLIETGNMQAPKTLADYVLRTDRSMPWALGGHAIRALRLESAIEPIKEERRP